MSTMQTRISVVEQKMSNLTKQEKTAIKKLEELSKIWPQSLGLFFSGTNIKILKYDWSENKDGTKKGYQFNVVDSYCVVSVINGIPCDSGD